MSGPGKLASRGVSRLAIYLPRAPHPRIASAGRRPDPCVGDDLGMAWISSAGEFPEAELNERYWTSPTCCTRSGSSTPAARAASIARCSGSGRWASLPDTGRSIPTTATVRRSRTAAVIDFFVPRQGSAQTAWSPPSRTPGVPPGVPRVLPCLRAVLPDLRGVLPDQRAVLPGVRGCTQFSTPRYFRVYAALFRVYEAVHNSGHRGSSGCTRRCSGSTSLYTI